jgi:HPt (histidine-containing phosphotransfer) domain-containing protein
LLHELFSIFKEEFPRQLQALQQAITGRDLTQIGDISHTLKGMLASLAVTGAAEQASQLEKAARAGHAESLGDALAVFEMEVNGLLSEVEIIMAAVRV